MRLVRVVFLMGLSARKLCFQASQALFQQESRQYPFFKCCYPLVIGESLLTQIIHPHPFTNVKMSHESASFINPDLFGPLPAANTRHKEAVATTSDPLPQGDTGGLTEWIRGTSYRDRNIGLNDR